MEKLKCDTCHRVRHRKNLCRQCALECEMWHTMLYLNNPSKILSVIDLKAIEVARKKIKLNKYRAIEFVLLYIASLRVL